MHYGFYAAYVSVGVIGALLLLITLYLTAIAVVYADSDTGSHLFAAAIFNAVRSAITPFLPVFIVHAVEDTSVQQDAWSMTMVSSSISLLLSVGFSLYIEFTRQPFTYPQRFFVHSMALVSTLFYFLTSSMSGSVIQ